jgi:hypothetical protein
MTNLILIITIFILAFDIFKKEIPIKKRYWKIIMGISLCVIIILLIIQTIQHFN